MKAFFYTVLFVAGLSTFSFAQERSSLAIGPNKSEFAAGKQTGKFTFILPAGTVADEVTQNAKYYTHYFTVDYVASSREAKINMVNNDDKSRSVIIRFLSANGIQEVNVGGVIVPISELFEGYLK
jgi:hypothetical protein